MKRLFLVTIIVLMAMTIGLYAQEKEKVQEEPEIKLELVWEKEFPSSIEDFILSEEKDIPTLQVVTTTEKAMFIGSKEIKEIPVKNVRLNEHESYYYHVFQSGNSEYVGVRKMHYADYGRIRKGSEYCVYNRQGELLVRKEISEDYQPGNVLLNNGAFLVTPGGLGVATLILEQLDGTSQIIFDCKDCDMMPSHYVDVAEEDDCFALNLSGIGVILYDDVGGEIWHKDLRDSHAAGIGISPYGNYIACFGKEWGRTLLVITKKGDLIWEKDVGAGTHFVSFSRDEAFLAVYATWAGIKFFDAHDGELLWQYAADEIGEKRNKDLTRSIYSIDVSPGGNFVVCADGGGTRELPTGDDSAVFLFDKRGNIVWRTELSIQEKKAPDVRFTDDGGHLIIANANQVHCYRIFGGEQ